MPEIREPVEASGSDSWMLFNYHCPYCNSQQLILDSAEDVEGGGIKRYGRCRSCALTFTVWVPVVQWLVERPRANIGGIQHA
jgi:transposase-like protein